ncbi:hypothetical protein DHD05_18210 [Arenibacter sp. N53]|uniref:hypothetical protein n=1 Tax=Arenibacter TaxID=178469 RepID=UPI000CD3C878|nr:MULTISPECIES: hypothetical protein [Arenibacter]MCM4153532.1 hypothetical protein [Arenibacter sp. N53]
MEGDNNQPKFDLSELYKNALKGAIAQDENKSLKAKIQLLEETIEHLQKDNDSLRKKGLESYKEYLDLKGEKEMAERKVQNLTSENKIMSKFLARRDYIYVTQFNELYWGDNYPALKVLFDFLQKMSCLEIGWSYFCHNMCLGNKEPINLNTTMLNKKELGYLLSQIKRFFSTEIQGSLPKYKTWLQEKISIDNCLINEDFIKNYLRDYNRGKKMVSKNTQEIDLIILKISDRYY